MGQIKIGDRILSDAEVVDLQDVIALGLRRIRKYIKDTPNRGEAKQYRDKLADRHEVVRKLQKAIDVECPPQPKLSTANLKCRHCGRDARDLPEPDYLRRVNKLGDPGIFQCDPFCRETAKN